MKSPSTIDLCIRFLPCGAIAKPGNDFKDRTRSLPLAARLERGVNGSVYGSSSVSGQYADNRVRLTLQENRLAKNAPVPGKNVVPEAIAQNRRLGSVGTVFIVGEVASQDGPQTQHFEVAGRNPAVLHVLHTGSGPKIDPGGASENC